MAVALSIEFFVSEIGAVETVEGRGTSENKDHGVQNKKGWIVVFRSPRHPTLHPQRLTPESATGLRTDPSQPEADPSFGGLRRNLKRDGKISKRG